jgi:hypothetical protein
VCPSTSTRAWVHEIKTVAVRFFFSRKNKNIYSIFNEKCAQVNVFSLERAKTFIAYLMKNFENKNIYSIFNEKYAQVKFCPQRINTCSII